MTPDEKLTKPWSYSKAVREVRLVAQGIEAMFEEDETGKKWVKRLRRAAYSLELEGPGKKFKVKL